MANEISVTVGPSAALTVQTGGDLTVEVAQGSTGLAVEALAVEGPEGPVGPAGPTGPTGAKGADGRFGEPDIPDLTLLFENGLI